MGFFSANSKDLGVPLAVLGIVLALITPMPGFLLDLLIVCDIMASVIVLMVAMYIIKPAEFSVFPTTLLLLTLFRLALNVSSTRLILMNGNGGTAAAGKVIEAFGNFVVGGNYIIGTVLFLVLIGIQYVVINHGAVRISEVTARFTLDALPGKQMSIDSDLNSGLIDETEARARRKDVAREAEFYGAMDGASRFTQRDAVASIMITGINIIAGFLIGVFQHGMDLAHAIQTYTILTIGDGLVTVIPALMISVSGGLIVTRASSEDNISTDFGKQMFRNPQPLMLASGVMLLLALFPGLPFIPFLAAGAGLGWGAWALSNKLATAKESDAALKPSVAGKDNIEALLRVDLLTVELGLGLVRFLGGGQESPLLKRISGIRRQLAGELGFLLGPVRVLDNVSFKAHEYVISLKGAEIGRHDIVPGHELGIPIGKADPKEHWIATIEPAFGLKGWWIPAEEADAARRSGFTVVDTVSVMGTYLCELVRRYSHELFTRQDAKAFLDRAAAEQPKAVEDLVPKLLQLATIQKVIQNLLRERVSVRDAITIVEALGEAGATTRNPILLTEYVRQALRRTVIKPFLGADGQLAAFLVDPLIEKRIADSVEHGETSSHLTLAPQAIREVLQHISRTVGNPETPVAVVVSSSCRYFLRQIVEPTIRNLFCVSPNELPMEVKMHSLGVIQLP